jgi:hypothetical protein
LDESCGIYVRADVNDGTEWEQANQVQFGTKKKEKTGCLSSMNFLFRMESTID